MIPAFSVLRLGDVIVNELDEGEEREPLIEDVADAYNEVRTLTARPDTVRMDGVYLEVFLRFCKTKDKRPTVAMLSRPLLDSYMAWLAKPENARRDAKGKSSGRPRKGVTIAKFVRAAQQMWKWAEDCDRWPGQIPRPRLISKDHMPGSVPQPVVAPTFEEMDACIHAAKGDQRKLATWLRLTGLRINESLQLMRSDVDLERGELTIRPEIDKKGMGRVIPLCALIVGEIKAWGRRDVGEERDGYLIPYQRRPRKRGAAFEREPRSRDMARAWKAAGVREAVWRRRPDHAFRKGFKTNLLALGAHPDALDALMGHKLGGGSRGLYIDTSRLPLRETLALIPPITVPTGNVITLPTRPADYELTSRKRRAAKRP